MQWYELRATINSCRSPRPNGLCTRNCTSKWRRCSPAERHGLANAANFSALLYQSLPDLNWVGFYFLQRGELVLGPFQGKVACVRIALGKGVCGTAAERRETLIVADVHEFAGHIACDAASRSEIVVPLIEHGRLIGVLDLDSPLPDRFNHDDGEGLEVAARLLLAGSDLENVIQ